VTRDKQISQDLRGGEWPYVHPSFDHELIYILLAWDTGIQIAVKRLKVWSTKAEMEFAVEVEILGRVRHKNLLRYVYFRWWLFTYAVAVAGVQCVRGIYK